MDWTEIIVAAIAGAGGFLGAIVSNNKQLAVLATKNGHPQRRVNTSRAENRPAQPPERKAYSA